MCEFVFFSKWSWCQSAVQSVVLHMEALLFISFYYFKIHCKKECYFVLKEVLFDWRKLFLMSPFMSFCCWFSFFLAHGCFCSCGREGCAMSYLIWGCFFYSFDDFFSMIWWNTIMVFFPPLFFVRFSVSCFFKKRKVFSCWFVKKVFVEWIGLFVEWVVGEFVFFLIPFLFNGI